MALRPRSAAAPQHHLSDAERRDRALAGGDLQRQVTDLAEIYGWAWVHFRAAKTSHGWRVPVSGPLGRGWPDLVLVHPTRGRVLGVEIKRQTGDDPTPDQAHVHELLRRAGLEVVVWRPADMTEGRIQEVLR